MVQSVELLVDADTDAAVRAEWRTLWDAGLPSLARVSAVSNRPHITLFVARDIPAEVDESLVRALGAADFPVTLGGLLLFGGRHVTLARAVVPSRRLLTLHRQVWDLASPHLDVPAHIAPGQWTPHVTLSRRLAASDLPEALRLIDRPEIRGHAMGLRRWDGDAKREWALTLPP
ncbi:2'-5' RNA ligase family protein [Rhodococcus triatomae]|uniref:2'-5' RNA ligase family protein n=1 Tax=Rhodococcus triatomae TaxID=300028 RepID=UPI000932722D|nr:2'-5' RNA ligase family protein [Rhodococcus triatomae]QNG21291.1 2'-5' RNA ligase family protein [Rhodococcus triatomae]QNG21712.1 2'-5' RNA ligase family protein [Rhodococcus triatomae]